VRACRLQWRLDSPTMSGPSKKSSSDDWQHLLVRMQRLRLEAEEFQSTLESWFVGPKGAVTEGKHTALISAACLRGRRGHPPTQRAGDRG